MPPPIQKTICWSPIWSAGFENCGFEYVVVSETGAHSTLLAVDEDGHPFRLAYRLQWDPHCRIREADFEVHQAGAVRRLNLRAERGDLKVGQRQEFRMAWVSAPVLSTEPKPQAYSRISDRLYLFESLDASGFRAELPVDDDGVVMDYPGLFRRVPRRG